MFIHTFTLTFVKYSLSFMDMYLYIYEKLDLLYLQNNSHIFIEKYFFLGEVQTESYVDCIQGKSRGRGMAEFHFPPKECLCQRQYSNILCQNCGHLMYGRVRYACPKHPQVSVVYLIFIHSLLFTLLYYLDLSFVWLKKSI